MKYNFPEIIHHHVPAKSKTNLPKQRFKSRPNIYRICLWVLIFVILLIAIILVGHRTITYDNPNYTNVSKVLPAHDWKIKFKTSSSLVNQHINMVADQQSWHFNKYGYVTINGQPQSAYNYLTTKHDLKLENSNDQGISNSGYLKFKLVKISHNKKYTFKSVKSNAIPHEDQREVHLILIKNGHTND